MKIIIPGGTGQVGTVLARAFHERGDEVIVLSRNAQGAPWRVVKWDAKTLGDWTAELEGAEVVINLAGRSINCRYNAENRKLITESRVKSTQVVGEAIARASRPPRVWLQASSATIYAHTYDKANDEAMLEIGAFLLRTETELILKSRRVAPGRLRDAGFVFQFPTWPEAAQDLCSRCRKASATAE